MFVNSLYVTTAIIEAGAGLALLCLPSRAAKLLLATPLQEPAACTVARVGGAGLLALGVACWLARNDTESSAARALVIALVIYNLVVALVLAAAGLRSQPVGIILWPAVVLHTAMTAWCVVSLRHPSIAQRRRDLQQ